MQGRGQIVGAVNPVPLCATQTGVVGEVRVVQEVCHTFHSPSRCSLETLPSSPLFSSTWVMSMPYLTAVVISARYWPNPPSPLTDTTLRRVAAQAPIAEGKPKPIEPR